MWGLLVMGKKFLEFGWWVKGKVALWIVLSVQSEELLARTLGLYRRENTKPYF